MAPSRLLLADDSITIQKVVNLTFSGEGIDVVCVSDGNSAIDLLREEVPDLVMADVNIPGVNGYEICEKVKSLDTARDIPVILLVGSFEPFDEEEAKRVGANGHLTKPFESIAALVAMVNGLLQGEVQGEAAAFDDTVEYPADHEMVVSASSIPFADGFEDETIETEQVGSYEEGSGEEDDVFRQVEGLETFGDEEVPVQESYAADEAPIEFEPGYDSADELREADEEPSHFYSDTPEQGETEDVFGERSETDDISAPEESPVQYEAWSEPEPAFDDGHSSEPVFEDEAGGDVTSEVYYREETYRESSYIERSYETEAPDTGAESESEGTYSPIPLGSADEHDQAPADFGAVTVELDESELLELPVDHSHSEEDAQGSVHEERPERIPQSYDFRSHEDAGKDDLGQGSRADFSGEIPEELVNEIARRVVERLSEKAVREIAWEVVPEMAELIIKKMTEQKLNE